MLAVLEEHIGRPDPDDQRIAIGFGGIGLARPVPGHLHDLVIIRQLGAVIVIIAG